VYSSGSGGGHNCAAVLPGAACAAMLERPVGPAIAGGWRMRILAAMLTATVLAGALPGVALAQSPPLEQGDPKAGLEVARAWCANCHVVERNQDRAIVGPAPTFHAIADRSTTTADGLRAFLATQHGLMPNLSLSNTNIENTVAYILSLRGQ
jgi:cytochrome c